MSKKILVTGANGGFGSLITETLSKVGHIVIGSMRDPEGKNKQAANALRKQGAQLVDIDVRDQHSVDRGVDAAISAAGGLDVLVNNAGVGVLGLQESYTAEDFQHLFDINVFGVQRVTRSALRQFHQQSSGLILNISSLLGRMTIPFYGPYNASKWALEAMSENYRTELSAFGIDVAVIEPGGFPTGFFHSLLEGSDPQRLDNYGDMASAPQAAFESFEQALTENPEQNPQLVANAVLNVIDTPAGQRPFRTVVDKMGMGDSIVEYNAHLDKVTQGIYTAFNTADMLELQL